MNFIADLHVHSKYSIATAKTLDLEHLYLSAQRKGIRVVGTGDFTHPKWMEELQQKLIPAEPGLYRLTKDLERTLNREVPDSCRQPVRFMLSAEISNIYKKNDKTRKNHNLILSPDFQAAQTFSDALDRIGNIRSDGRPILGLDARNLMEILLEISDQAMLIPAHIWTPWFSLLGSNSGFDSVEACFEDLTPYIFAVETGLSSDPAMNWRVSDLDNMTLVSNSDAHSPLKLGREANRFNCKLSYGDIRKALQDNDPDTFKGTLEFFPEEGKYHLDGHKKCGVRFEPSVTIANNGICPVCEKPLTVGVLNRVETLADNKQGRKSPKARPYQHVVSLTEIISQIMEVGPQSKTVRSAYEETLTLLGDEFSILLNRPIEAIGRKSPIALLGEAIRRVRSGNINLKGGYDGVFGKIRIFKEDEKKRLMGQKPLFTNMHINNKPSKKELIKKSSTKLKPIISRIENTYLGTKKEKKADLFNRLNPEQQQAISHGNTPLIIPAGPGTGKTMTITARMVSLIKVKNVPAQQILAVTFTHKAAEEMKRRLDDHLKSNEVPHVATFHAFCLALLEKRLGHPPVVIDDPSQEQLIKDAIAIQKKGDSERHLTAKQIAYFVMSSKQRLIASEAIVTGLGEKIDRQVRAVAFIYQNLLEAMGVCDFEDLINKAVALMKRPPATEKTKALWDPPSYQFIFVDEYQDINDGQYLLLRELVPDDGKGLCVIGDPNQAIYGFRGSNVLFFNRFLDDFKDAKQITLTRNYRSTQKIVRASLQMINKDTGSDSSNQPTLVSCMAGGLPVHIIKSKSDRTEAAAIGKIIVSLVGGRGYHDIDLGHIENHPQDDFGFGDIAVIYRTRRQGEILKNIFQKMGIPCQMVVRRRMSPHPEIKRFMATVTVLLGKPMYEDLFLTHDRFFKGISKKTMKAFKKWGLENRLCVADALAQASLAPIATISRTQQIALEKLSHRIDDKKKLLLQRSLHKIISAVIEEQALLKDDVDPEVERGLQQMTEIAKEKDATRWLSLMALQTDTDIYEKRAQKVALMTLHAVKGLEFPVVFVCGCEDGLIPFYHETMEKTDPDEEKRLFYVAMTRAKQRLYLSWAQKRRLYGKLVSRERSSFIDAIEESLTISQTGRHNIPRPKHTQKSLFDIGRPL